MSSHLLYSDKFDQIQTGTGFERLSVEDQSQIQDLAHQYHFTHQELRQVVEAHTDLHMWNEKPLMSWWKNLEAETELQGRERKKHLLAQLSSFLDNLRSSAKTYPQEKLPSPQPGPLSLQTQESPKTVFGMCPVASEKTVCCNLRTIDIVQNCGFGCSYCCIQSFYSDNEVTFQTDILQKLKEIKLDPDRFYHIGTGQSSDSLLWGNKNGVLDALLEFAQDHPNVLLEFKTKSNNVSHLLNTSVPANIVCSWSLNAPTIVENEEHKTAPLEKRIAAARSIADCGIKVAFHFHPLVYFDRWQEEYRELVGEVLNRFSPLEVAFISFGSMTLSKSVIRKIRERGEKTKVLQMPLVPNPEGKLTYPSSIKTKLFRFMYEQFAPWRTDVFFYLCMEEAKYWISTFGTVYPDNTAFEKDFEKRVWPKFPAPTTCPPVIPAKAGIHTDSAIRVDPRLRGDDKKGDEDHKWLLKRKGTKFQSR